MVFMPPGYAKTLYTSILFPGWFFAQEERLNIIGCSYASSLAEEISGKLQGYVTKNQSILGYGLLTHSVKRWQTTNGGQYTAAGTDGGITGRRSNLTIIDDPIKGAKEAESLTVRDAVWNWYLAEVYLRKKAMSTNRIVLVQTRWNEDDLAGRLLQAQADGGDRWKILRLPAICDSPDDPLGRTLGEPLWPEYEDKIALEGGIRPSYLLPDGSIVPEEFVPGVRKNVQEYVWGSLYQQDPKPRGASFFNVDLLLVPRGTDVDAAGNPCLEPVEMPKRIEVVFSVIDTAIKTGQKRDCTGVVYFGYDPLLEHPLLILDWDLVQIEGADQEAWLPSVIARGEYLAGFCHARRGSAGALIEDKSTGTVLIQQAANQARREGRRVPLARAIDSKLTAMGKDERAMAAAPYVAGNLVKITREAWDKVKSVKGRSANHFVLQVGGFRLGASDGASDDLLDCFTYGGVMALGSYSGERKGI